MAARSEMSPPRSTGKGGVWRALEDHYATMRSRHLRDLFAHDPVRGERMTAEGAGTLAHGPRRRM